MASPQAGEQILAWVAEMGLSVPALPLQNALIQCTAERPQMLLPYLQHAESSVREVLGRVVGEVATPSLGLDLLEFVGDEVDELRAAAARGMSHTKIELALDVLTELAHDSTWFVRLRAIVSLGQLSDRLTIPALLRGITDANRLVRFRAAEGLVEFKTEMVPIFAQVTATRDRYGLHAYLTALENANLRGKLEEELQASTNIPENEKHVLRNVLLTGKLSVAEVPITADIPEHAAALR
jgi:HEAT repeat protein